MAEEPVEPPPEARDRATWAEVFYDLVLVFGVSQVAHIMAESASWHSLAQSVLILLPLWWSWVSITLALNTVSETHAQRLLLFTAALATFLMGVCAPSALKSAASALVFAGAYLALRLLLAQATRRTTALSPSINHHSVGWAVACVMTAGAALPAALRETVWGVAVLTEIAIPLTHPHRLRAMTFGPSHLPERFGLFIIIALGECVGSSGLHAASAWADPVGLCALAGSFVAGCALWWLYFNFAASSVEHALRTHRSPAVVVRDVLSYGHFVLVLSLLLVASGANRIIAEPTLTPRSWVAALLPVGAALFTLTFGYTRWRMFGAATWSRMGAGTALLLCGAVAPELPALLTMGLTTAVLVAVNLFEHWIITTRRPIPLFFARA